MSFFNKITEKVIKQSSEITGKLVGNELSHNSQLATNAAVENMELLRNKINSSSIQNGVFDAQKGNLFEYIEAAKFNVNSAYSGSTAKAIVTDASGDPHATADILIQKDGKLVKEVQAKFIKSSKEGRDNSAAKSVREHTGADNKGWGQYDGMDRLIRKQDNYNSNGSLLNEAKELAKKRADSGSIYSEYYKDVHDYLTDELNYDGVTSGGTTYEEVKTSYDSSDKYISNFEHKQLIEEMKCSAINMAKASFVTSGITSGVINMFKIFKDEKTLAEAISDVGADAIESSIKGGTAGVISTAIRYEGVKKGSKLLSDSTASTVMAGSLVDGGVALYSYARGEITAEELKEELIDSTVKATTTIYYTKAIEAIMGKAVNPIVPMAVYTTANYVIACTREILQNAKLNQEEYERLASIYQESTKEANKYRVELDLYISKCEKSQIQLFNSFIDSFDYNISTGENYDKAINSIVQFADRAGIELQNVSFDSFSDAMRTRKTFVLK